MSFKNLEPDYVKDESLVNAIRPHAVLYDFRSKDHKHAAEKTRAWQSIAQVLGLTSKRDK